MKWFKHLTASGSDPDIGSIVDEFGFKGYYLFFRTVEVMSIEFDVENPGKNTFNFHWFLDQFPRKIDRKTLINFLNSTQKKRRIYYSLNGKDIHLNCPKLKDLTDEYTEKIVRQKSGQNPDKIPIKVGIKSRTKNKKEEVRSNIYTPQFNKFWAEYPNKKEKDVAFEVFERLKEKEKQQVVMAARNYRIKIEREKQEKRFIKHPATFLRKNRWKDHLESPKKEEMEEFDEIQEKAMEEKK